MSPRPPLDVGTYGKIVVSGSSAPYKARARYRDHDGIVRTVARFAQTKSAAERALKKALTERQRSTGDTINGNTTVAELADAWLADAAVTNLASNTQDAYGYIVKNQIKPALGGVRLSEVGVAVVNRALRTIKTRHGPGAAKTTKTALSGMFKHAIGEEAMTANPMRDAITVGGGESDPVRALTVTEVEDLSDLLRVDDPTIGYDLADLVDCMLATGLRIGEACAVGHRNCPGRHPHRSLDLEAGTVEIDATLVRLKGKGMTVQHRTKSDAGWRVLALPPFAVAMFERRAGELRLRAPNGIVFGSPRKRALRDPSNTAGDLRAVLDRVGCPDCDGRGWHAELKTAKQQAQAPQPRDVTNADGVDERWHEPCDGTPPFAWVHAHTFRKTVATRMDQAGCSAREIADQLGHAKPSMTLDVYMGRDVVSAAAAKILDR